MSGNKGEHIITDNRRAGFDYEFIETFEVGIKLTGSEVRTIRSATRNGGRGGFNIAESYVTIDNGHLIIRNSHIDVLASTLIGRNRPHAERRDRILLAHRSEIERIADYIKRDHNTCVPLNVHKKNGHIKLTIAVAKGKTKGDKREAIKERDWEREQRQLLR